MAECALVLLTALLLDALLGDHSYPLHPVKLMGTAISSVEAVLRRMRLSGILGGGVLVIAILSLFLGGYLGLHFALFSIQPRLTGILDVFLVYSCVAFRDLFDHARPIAAALDKDDLSGARSAVQKIVGRDAARLDARGVARAAVESVAESFVDGLLSPLFWYVVGGTIARLTGVSPCLGAVCGVLTYRAGNTLDSMVGYRNERYSRFGRIAARLDDMLNFLPARLAVVILFLAAIPCRLHTFNGLKIAWRDRLKHTSPNAGHAESYVAGALGVSLGGPTVYAHGTVDKPWLGEGPSEVATSHIRACCRLVFCAGWISAGTMLIILWALSRSLTCSQPLYHLLY